MKSSDVSRETFELLKGYVALLEKWTRKINLVAPSTESQIWTRHVDDCLSGLSVLRTQPHSWIDLGSGAGFPGLIAAILYRDTCHDVTLVESDLRKSAFLRTVSRELSLNACIVAERIEAVSLDTPEVISARALARVDKLLDLTRAHHDSKCTFLFMKGRHWKTEIDEARQRYDFALEVHPSKIETGSATLLITDVKTRDHAHR